MNDIINNEAFPDWLSFANIMPVFKNIEPTGNENYRPFSVPPLLLKAFEPLIYDQLSE